MQLFLWFLVLEVLFLPGCCNGFNFGFNHLGLRCCLRLDFCLPLLFWVSVLGFGCFNGFYGVLVLRVLFCQGFVVVIILVLFTWV